MSSTAKITHIGNYTLDGAASPPARTSNIIFDGGRIQGIPVDDNAGQNDTYAHYLGAGLNLATYVRIVNLTGWDVDVDPNFNGSPITIPPGGEQTWTFPGDADYIDNMNNGIYAMHFELSSASGSAGTISCEILGVV